MNLTIRFPPETGAGTLGDLLLFRVTLAEAVPVAVFGKGLDQGDPVTVVDRGAPCWASWVDGFHGISIGGSPKNLVDFIKIWKQILN